MPVNEVIFKKSSRFFPDPVFSLYAFLQTFFKYFHRFLLPFLNKFFGFQGLLF